MKNIPFAKGVEGLVNPIDVGSLHFIQAFNRLLPKSIQQQLVQSSAKTIPYMGFVVEPYAFFLCYELLDLEKAKSLLPDGFELIKTKIFDTDEPKYYCIFGCFRAHTSAFWGSRVEFYVIAEDKSTGLLSWIIIDYDTNTISYDKLNGLRSPNSSKAVITINHEGTVFVDVQRDDSSRGIVLDCNIRNGKMSKLDQRLWLEGNLSIGYGRVLSKGEADIFSLKFEPCEVHEALKLEQSELKLAINSWFPGLFNPEPSQILCFPYAQHFVSDSPGHSSKINNKHELINANEAVDFENVKVFSTKSFRDMFLIGMGTSAIVTTILLILLYFK